MKLHLLNRSSQKHRSFSVSHHKYQHFLKVWHYHPELELVFIKKSTGTRYIGDNSSHFDKHDVVLIGEHLPHMWVNDTDNTKKSKHKEAEAIVVHFKKDFLGDKFFMAPENKRILNLLNKASRGLQFLKLNKIVVRDIKRLLKQKPFERMVSLVNILNKLTNHKKVKTLSSAGYLEKYLKTGNDRLDKMYEFIFDNFKSTLQSHQVADYIGMNNSAFSRFFKRLHKKTFTAYLNEVRVGYACKLLIEDNLSISNICYASGFNNLSNFNRQFKLITKHSPSKYLQAYTKK